MMSRENEPLSTEGEDESGLLIVVRVLGLLVVGPAVLLYVISLLVN